MVVTEVVAEGTDAAEAEVTEVEADVEADMATIRMSGQLITREISNINQTSSMDKKNI